MALLTIDDSQNSEVLETSEFWCFQHSDQSRSGYFAIMSSPAVNQRLVIESVLHSHCLLQGRPGLNLRQVLHDIAGPPPDA